MLVFGWKTRTLKGGIGMNEVDRSNGHRWIERQGVGMIIADGNEGSQDGSGKFCFKFILVGGEHWVDICRTGNVKRQLGSVR